MRAGSGPVREKEYSCSMSRISWEYVLSCRIFPDNNRGVIVIEPCQEFRGQTVLQIEAVHNLRKVCMYLNVLSLHSITLRESRKGNLKKIHKIDYLDFLVKN